MKIMLRSSTMRLVASGICVFFFLLMLQITLQYIPPHPDVAFLRIKQDVVNQPFYLQSFYIHVLTSMFALVAGFFQFSNTLRIRSPKVHRTLGYIYILVILVFSGPASLWMSFYANGGWSSQLAFVLLALLWWFTTFMAWKKARDRNFSGHQKWMIRSYALTCSAITLRLWKWGIVAVWEPRPMDVYRWVAWLGWVVNLIVAEWIILRLQPRG